MFQNLKNLELLLITKKLLWKSHEKRLKFLTIIVQINP